MKLTKKLEAEILETYYEVFDANLRGDMRTFASILDENCHIFGTAASEVFKNKKAAVKFYTATAGQVTGKVELRNRNISVMAIDNDVMVNEQADFYILIDDQWTFYNPCRVSCLFHKKNNQWKTIHMHGSFPDSKTEEGEQVNTDKIKAENIQLRDAVKRRTAELENKNRELEIETSLEKVRTVAMGMRKPENFPDVCEVLFKELQSLGFNELRNAMVNIHNDEKRSFVNYDYSDEIGKSITPLVYDEHPVIKKQIKQIRKADDAFSESVFKGKDLEDWKIFRKSRGEKNDKRIRNIKALYYYFYSIGTGSIGISTFDKINEEKKDVLKRFRNVFAFAYRRYIDVAQAEAQAKEAQIEAALERVRSRTNAMHRSENLHDVINEVNDQLHQLGFRFDGTDFLTNFSDKGYNIWLANFPTPIYVPAIDHKLVHLLKKAIKRGDDFLAFTLTTVEKNIYFKNIFENTIAKIFPEELKQYVFNAKGMATSCVVLENIILSVTNFAAIPYTDTENEILKRFAKVFEQSYTRFLDLQKAEAQAKEARIELALERVRARAMAMHNSSELAELVSTVFNELTQLDFKLTSCIIWIHDHENTKNTLWIASTEINKPAEPFLVNVFHNDFFRSINHAWRSKDTKWVYTFTGKEKKNFEKAFFKEIPQLPVPLKNALKVPEQVVFSASFNNFGALEIVETEALTDEKFEILHRFGKVFDLSYTRFNDLKKAEAQIREAQIETALERVRSKTMAMHKSEEVTGIAVSLNEELLKLGFEGGSTIIIIDKETGDTEQWTGFSEDKTLQSCNVPYFKHPYHNDLLAAWKRDENFLVYTVTGKEKKTLDEHYFATGYKDFPESDKKWMRQMGSVTFSHAFMKYGAIHWGPGHLTEEQLRILQRFSKVFEQSYTRFLDLQKAEAQAREAKIEAALERVRSRSMAMHKSNDLQEVIKVVTEQLIALDLKFDHANFSKITSDGSWDMWISTQKHSYPAQVHVPYIDLKIFNDLNEIIAKGSDFFTEVYSNEEKNKFFKHFFENTIAKDTPEERIQYVLNANGFARSVFLTKNIWFSVGNYRTNIFTDEENAIFKRFANVFEQAYTRFLDLQKAEAQAIEAQIEAALERVRSRSMAMHKSDDLHEVIKVVTEQLSALGLKFNAANFAKIDPDSSWDLWLSTPEQAYPAIIHVPYLDHPIFNDIIEQVAKNNDFYTRLYNQEEANIFFHHFFENTIAKHTAEERKRFVYSSKGFARSLFLTKNIWFSVSRYDSISFSDEENAIFKRFANVFEQAYTRFLDLQKAEAQAREADIELSLERVRAKTMAMQKPSEFADIINIIGEQFIHLGFDIDWANFGANGFAISEGIDIWNFAVIPGASPISARVFIPYFDHPVFTNSAANINEFLNGGRDLITVTLDKQTKDTWLDHMFTETIFKDVPEEYRAIQYAKPGYTTSNISIKDTWLSIGKFDSRPFTDEQHLILRRFANAFGQANTRFLDLQKAEAQAREAQIEASLERVRSRAMAMQNSDELRELIGTVFTELTKLDIVLTRCLIMIYDPRSNDSVWWMANSEAPTEPIGLRIQNHGLPPYVAYLKAWQEKKLNWVYVLEGAVKKDWDDFLFVETELSHLPDFVIAGMKAPERVYLNSSFNSFGNLTLATLEPLSNEHFDILLRFAKVFDLTYTRFNDLKQAEAQARESKIELALERVRARTMAMQKSDELAEAAQLLYNEFGTLGINTILCGYMFINEEKNSQTAWTVLPDGTLLPNSMDFPLTGDHVLNKRYEDWKQKKPLHILAIQGEVNKEHHRFLSDYVPSFVVENVFSRLPNRIVFHCANFSNGYLLILAANDFSSDDQQTIIRFAKVFEMTYRRFLDLKQAEAQTREAQIELALERVRARTMAMHKSVELAETAQVLFQQLSELGGIPDRISIGIADETNSVVNFWTTDQQGSHLDHSFSARLNERTTIAKTYQAWKEQKRSLVIDLHGEELTEWIKFAREEMGITVNDDQIKDRRVHSLAFFSHGWILATSHEPQSSETIQILERFASVFNLTYRRFLDLQKAEAQAREAQIEAALERVRSSSLAMHKSEELKDVVKIVFENFRSLGLQNIDSVNINIFHEGSRDFDLWLAAPGQDYTTNFRLPYLDHPIANDFFNDVKKGETIHKGIYDHDLKNKYFEYMFENSDNKHLPEERKKLILNGRAYSVATGIAKHSSIFIHNYNGEKFSEETNGILVRFSKVFDQAYTRFLDLQKAEAQAREAQIETVLERVRSRTMAMQKSNELTDVAGLLFEQVSALGIKTWTAGFNVWSEDNNSYVDYITSPQGGFIEPYTVYTATAEALTDISNARKSGVEFDVQYVEGEKIKQLYLALTKLDEKQYEIMLQDGVRFPSHQYEHFVFGSKVSLMFITYEPVPEAHDIFKRLGKVFEQTYTRFLDLQKSEAQVREAQIESALEKVRSHTMGMRSSEDLANVASVMFDQMRILGGDLFSFGIVLCDKHENMVEQWHGIPGAGMLAPFFVPVNLDHIHQYRYDQWKTRTELFSIVIPEEYIAHHFELMLALPSVKAVWEGIVAQGLALPPIPTWEIDYGASFRYGYLLVSALKPFEEDKIFPRFAKVFEQAYTRFLDLQKAEAQAKEAQIEAALEKVRSRSLAMHKSDELQEVVNTVFERLSDLDIEADSSNIAIFKEGSKDFDYWIASKTQRRSASFHMPYVDLSLTKDVVAARESGKEFSTTAYSFEEKNEWFDFAFKETDFKFLSEERKEFILNAPAITVAIAFSKHTGVQVNRYNSKLLTEAESEILKRFSKVFEQAYIRFLDLEKAEAQAKEAQIEASLERVRSKTMAMHNSQDVGNTVATMFDQLVHLGVKTNRCGILIFSDTNHTEVWTAKSGSTGEAILIIGHLDVTIHPMLQRVRHAWTNKETFISYELAGDDIKNYYNAINNYPDYPTRFNLDNLPSREIHSDFFFPEGAVFSFTSEPVPEEDALIFKRFAGVFGQTYRRYLDLQKAEANAREAQIEAGLERVRARTMAMHSSEDVSIATATMFTELEKLGIENFRGGITNIIPNRTQHVWSVNNLEEGKVLKSVGTFNIDAHPFWQLMYKEWEAKKDFIHYYLAGEDKQDYFEVLNAIQGYLPQNFQQYPDLHFQVYYFNEGAVWTNSLQPHSEEDKQVMKRFTSVFSLTYRRYQDLRKAEAQAKEATIEAALERVRGKAMAMHSSKDLASTIGIFYHELEGLDLTPRRCGIGLIDKETKRAEISTMNASADGEGIELIGNLDLGTHPVLTSVYNNWLTKTEYHPVLRGNEIKEYYQIVRPQIDFPDYPNDTVQYGYFIFFDEGGVYAWTEKELSEEELKIYRRFTSVLSLTYKRYKDLKDAEASAQAAIKDAALDRIRADIASMRTINDLDRITPLIWNELTVLGVPFIRCGVFIMDEEEELIHTFLSTPDGKAIAAFHLSYDTPGNLNHVVSNWKIKNKYLDHWDESEFKQFADILVEQGTLASAEQYLKTIPKGGFYLHFLPFLQGMLYVGNTTQLRKEEIELIQHVADAFSTAYARYEDFNKLEAAKQQVEKTLTDLKQAQTQLVQSEKMASLGEMTAGIAHEIQNPLNFVNNFSEVSKELLDEMKTELETGNTEDAKDIADDVIQNLEKINHHGKRADAIVKSMLQHSRSSSGKKEPADINGLADEYLRLAYHGLRAKDKSFNAKFETEFDSSIGKINIISQDIGRVLVNLINNAFYAVSERKKQESNGYEPTVTVHTKKTDDKIEIKVKDNGNGIPQKVLDKIFQPFFTTKPTGQGTGLGLSLAYDIVTKGHGGELKVETKEGEGSEFIIQLPVSKSTES